MVKVGQGNGLPAHIQIFDSIKKSLEVLDTHILIAASTYSCGNLILVGRPLPDIGKLTMYDGIFVIVPVQDKGSRLSLSKIAQLMEGTNPALIRISASLMEKLVSFHLNNL